MLRLKSQSGRGASHHPWVAARLVVTHFFKKKDSSTPVVEAFSSDQVAFRTPSNINNGAPLQKQPTTLTCRLFPQKSSTTNFRRDSKHRSDWRCCECEVWVDGNCIEFVSTGCFTRKWLRFDQAIRNLTSGDLGILLVVIILGLT